MRTLTVQHLRTSSDPPTAELEYDNEHLNRTCSASIHLPVKYFYLLKVLICYTPSVWK